MNNEYLYYRTYLNTNISLMSDEQVRRMEQVIERAAPMNLSELIEEEKEEKQELEENKI